MPQQQEEYLGHIAYDPVVFGFSGEKLRSIAFQRKMLSLGILQRTEKQYSSKTHKAPNVYSFIQE